jgi:MraZ protein
MDFVALRQETMAFLGKFEHGLDDKNRVVLPQGFRKQLTPGELAEGFVLVAGRHNQYLELLPMQEWARLEKKLEEAYPFGDAAAEDYSMDLHASVVNVELDKQFRFLIPDSSRDLAGIEREVCFIGMGKKVVIWARERWEKRQRDRRESMAPPPVMRGERSPSSGE